MAQLETNRPVLHREKETREAIHFMDEVGREVNIIARNFNSGYGTANSCNLLFNAWAKYMSGSMR